MFDPYNAPIMTAPDDTAGLEKYTHSLVFRSTSGCRTSEKLDDFQYRLTFLPYFDARKLPILRNFKALTDFVMSIYFIDIRLGISSELSASI